MAWFKVDDNLAFHSKSMLAGNAAMGLWVRAGSWSAQQLTEGFVPTHMIASLGTRAQALALVKAKLWTQEPGGFRFWQWNDEGRQPRKEDVLAERAAARDRQRRARERSAQSRRDGSVTDDVTSGDVTVPPTRPDPTRRSSSDEELLSGEEKAAPKGKEVRLAASWAPTVSHYARARKDGIDIAAAVDAFRLHAETHDRHAVNWNAAFTTWLSKTRPAAQPVVDPYVGMREFS